MSSIEHRRRAWAALKLGPLWQPIAGALPNAPTAPSSSGTVEDPPSGISDTLSDVWPAEPVRMPAELRPQTPEEARADTPGPMSQPVPVPGALDVVTPVPMPADAPDPSAPASPSLSPSPTSSHVSGDTGTVPADSPADEAWLPGGELEMSEEAWEQMAAEAAYYASSAPSALDPMPDEPDSAGVAHPPSTGAPGAGADPATPAARPDRSLPDEVRWQQLREAVGSCQRCGLADTRQNTVFGRGRPGRARWMLIGEAPGAEEDRRGEAFVGQAGQLLDAMLSAAGIDPASEVFIANVLKCRPPGNRNPELYEVNQCEGYLHEQIRLADPECILLLGRFAAQSVLNSSLSINRLRSRVHHIRLAGRDVPVVCTFHPAYLLRNPLDKLKSWEDLCLARSVLDSPGQEKLPLPPRRSAGQRD